MVGKLVSPPTVATLNASEVYGIGKNMNRHGFEPLSKLSDDVSRRVS